ncbi:hypothetical protein SAPIO_CDS1573 [Scedosporium apiospermum]|uniref:Uncharacterized protein n=1 Tax=Pseudallescheria apiosperma TaxID=563466 RepID=A0A084GEK5_PSEDA|nr:uncharacterized protein SAPIO_CDS1573 [Scedosporium apiospermum]KEZ45767.1 hypothetical protein SAPIO_CDS1573 [Scedosporium apiospermum]
MSSFGTLRALAWVVSLGLVQPVLADGCSGLEEHECCFASWSSYWSSKDEYEAPTTTTVYYTESWTQDAYNPSLTTLCDGFPRALDPVPEFSTVTVSLDEPKTTLLRSTYASPAPTCTIADEHCAPYLSDFESAFSSYNGSNATPHSPPCTTYTPCPRGDGVCKMMATEGVKVYYWPATVTGDLCGERTTITHPEPARSTIVDGTTFVSPSVYVSISHLQAAQYWGQYKKTACGKWMTDFVVSLDPSDVNTHWGPRQRRTAVFKQLNLADLNNPIPATAFFGLTELPNCAAAPESCTSTIPYTNQPRLSAPYDQLRALNSELDFCSIHPSQFEMIGPVTWIPLEPTGDSNWPEPTEAPTEASQPVVDEPIETGS